MQDPRDPASVREEHCEAGNRGGEGKGTEAGELAGVGSGEAWGPGEFSTRDHT